MNHTNNAVRASSQAPQCLLRPVDDGVRGRVLVAEDDLINLMALTKMLERMGFEVHGVTDGEAALEAVQEACYDALLLDIRMPRLSGLDVAQRIRAMGLGKDELPIIAITAYALRGDRERFLAEGMNAYLAKPFIAADLANTLARFFPA